MSKKKIDIVDKPKRRINAKEVAVALGATTGSLLSSKWAVGFKDRGLGRGDFGVIVENTGELVVECPSREIAQHISDIHNEKTAK